MKKDTGKNLNRQLKEYCAGDTLPMHMPGHKRNPCFGFQPFSNDITEISGFDNLHNPDPNGLIGKLQQELAGFYGVSEAYISVNGTTGAILTAIAAMSSGSTRILAARNCHMCVWNACELLKLDVVTVSPELFEKGEFAGEIKASSISEALEAYPDIKLVVITSPTYEGILSDVNSIAEVCRKHGAFLLADSAHGAHSGSAEGFPDGGLNNADITVRSLHKTLACPTGTAVLLSNNEKFSKAVKHYTDIFETSSPSYILMQGISAGFEYIEKNPECLNSWAANVLNIREKMAENLKHLRLVTDAEPSKITIMTDGFISGHDLADILRSEYRIEIEAAFQNHIIAMTGMGDTPEGLERFYEAVLEIDGTLQTCGKSGIPVPLSGIHEISGISEAYLSEHEFLDLDESVGKISGGYVWNYPPGIPILLPGEKITKNQIAFLKASGRTSKIEVVLR